MKDFLKYVLANFVALAVVGGGCLALFFLFLGATLVSSSPPEQIPDKSVLVLNLSTPIVNKPASEDLSTLFQQMQGSLAEPLSLHQVLESLKRAADDDRVVGLFLTGYVAKSSWAMLTEVRGALTRFKESGKPIIAYGNGMREVDYFMASVADEVLLNPTGDLEFNGFASQVMFWKSAFEKYGLQMQITRVGKYKSAVEPYLTDKMSDANRAQITQLLDDNFRIFVETVAEARGLRSDQLYELANLNALLPAEAAKEAGLVDKLAFYDEVLDRLRVLTGEREQAHFKDQISLRKYAEATSLEGPGRSRNRVVVIYVEGTIVDGGSREDAGAADITRLLRRARLDATVKAVVLRVNSPGGTITASEIISREVRLLKEVKPLVVSMGGMAASGGYWISADAHEIFAQPNTVTGSIGVYGMFLNYQNLMNQHGLTVDVAKTSNMADIMTAYRPKTPVELASLQTHVDKAYEGFLDRVSEGREIVREEVHEMAQGRVWSGARALELGLVDQLGGLETAVEAAAKRAELDEYQWYHYQRPKKFAEELMTIMDDREHYISRKPPGPVQTALSDLEKTIKTLSKFDQPNQVYVLLPYLLNIN